MKQRRASLRGKGKGQTTMRAIRRTVRSRALTAILATIVVAALPTMGARAGTIAFGAPVKVNPDGTQGYEPGIEIDSVGTIFMTAHKFFPFAVGVFEEGHFNSYLWRSTDGVTFTHLAGGEQFPGIEGDFAIDGNDTLYFVDTTAVDNDFAAWTDHGATLRYYRPVTPTIAPVDDRPWLTAHGNGYVYLLVNLGYTPAGRLWLFRSTDGGQTFDPTGTLFPNSGWGTPKADPNSSYVYVAMNNKFYTGALPASGGAKALFVWISSDRGMSFHRVKVADYEVTDPDNQWVTTSVDGAGNVYIGWTDGNSRASKLKLSRSRDHGESWRTFDVTPTGLQRNEHAWFEADPRATGLVGVGWNTSNDAARKKWAFDAGIIRHALGGKPKIDWTMLDPNEQQTGSTGPPLDFQQVAFAPDHRLHVAWGHWAASFDILYAAQSTRPNF